MMMILELWIAEQKYSKCSCKTRFARLCAVENEGADEAASQPKTAVDANAEFWTAAYKAIGTK